MEEDHARRPRKALLAPIEEAAHGLAMMGDFNHTILLKDVDELVMHMPCLPHDPLLFNSSCRVECDALQPGP